ncbi:MAG: hypothetical protein HOL38_03970, partial [Verrucomicrobia bacterium]|nr:hypothetical protein [Verrucomicrobiota bacterium]
MDWSYLNKSQQEAFRRSLYVIEEAVEGLPTTQESPLAELIDVGRESRSVFLSGDRGSGKTSVLLSLMAYTLPYRSGLTPPDYKSTNDRFETALNKMKKRVVWLKPIDMEPLPVAFSLLASILIRIEEACERITRSNRDDRFRGPGNGDALFSEAMQELQMLQSEISLAWESNLPE